MDKKIYFYLAMALTASFAMADAPKVNFVAAKNMQDVFSTNAEGQASFIYAYMPYNDWKAKEAGRAFTMEVAPVLSGKASGGVPLPAPQRVDESQFKNKLEAEFARAVNVRNQGGRAEAELKAGGTPQKLLAKEQAGTHVVQTVMAGVVNRPFSQLALSPEKFAAMVKAIDVDHSHFVISGSLALNALDKDHIGGRTIQPNRAYLLSVFDFRDYGCPALKDGIRDHFSDRPEKDRLMNESLYVISDLKMNEPADVDATQKILGKKPDAVVVQDVIYADHLIRGAKTVFAFYAEGNNTRVVLISNLATRSKYFTGVKGTFIRQAILDGPNGAFGGLGGAVLSAKDGVSAPKKGGAADDLLADAEHDVNEKNTCERGLGLGLIRYSKSLFTQFEGYLKK